MRILIVLTYYRPHVSGLTIYAERLARGLAARGHRVTVLTSRYERRLRREETIEGVRIVRVPVVGRISKGVLMPTIGSSATALTRRNDVVLLHLPQFDAAGIALRGKLFRRPTVVTYHCDIQLPPSRHKPLIDAAVFGAHYGACRLADRVVCNAEDYAAASRFLRRFAGKTEVIGPPVAMPAPSVEDVVRFRAEHGLGDRPVIGYAARFSAEKGIEHLVEAAPSLIERFPGLRILFAGPGREAIGEDGYWRRLEAKIASLGEHWRFVGMLPAERMPAYLGTLDSLLVTSVNATESFGLIQAEAMLCGTPVVSTDLPGVRLAVTLTGMGEIVPPANAPALAAAVERVLTRPERYARPRAEIAEIFDEGRTIRAYEALFERLIAERRA